MMIFRRSPPYQRRRSWVGTIVPASLLVGNRRAYWGRPDGYTHRYRSLWIGSVTGVGALSLITTSRIINLNINLRR